MYIVSPTVALCHEHCQSSDNMNAAKGWRSWWHKRPARAVGAKDGALPNLLLEPRVEELEELDQILRPRVRYLHALRCSVEYILRHHFETDFEAAF